MALHRRLRIGQFRKDSYGILRGYINGLGLGSVEVMSEDVLDREGKSYFRLIADPSGAAHEIGVAFARQKGNLSYYSVMLDSPLFTAPLYAALFPDRELEDIFNLLWDRPQGAPKPTVDADANNGQTQGRRYIGSGATP